jgi:hypothetical protein
MVDVAGTDLLTCRENTVNLAVDEEDDTTANECSNVPGLDCSSQVRFSEYVSGTDSCQLSIFRAYGSEYFPDECKLVEVGDVCGERPSTIRYFEGDRDLGITDSACCENNPDAEGCGSAFIRIKEDTPFINAQETPRSTGSVLQASTQGFNIEESGRYVVFQDGDRVTETEIVVEDDAVEVRLFEDTNGNGIKDEGENFIENYSEISISREASVKEYLIDSGWNLINLPLIDTRVDNPIRTAADLITHWNEQSAEITHIARYRGGQFDIYSLREDGTSFDTNFDIIPGEALFVLNTTSQVRLTFSGNEFEESVPVQLSNGWNLVGIVAPNTDYDSEGVLNALSDQGFDASTISQFENGLYESVISDEDVIFGNNFNVIDKRGYFIRVESGGDNQFTP